MQAVQEAREAVEAEARKADSQSRRLRTWSQDSRCPTCLLQSAGAESRSAKRA